MLFDRKNDNKCIDNLGNSEKGIFSLDFYNRSNNFVFGGQDGQCSIV